jgi:hypothetical protein
LHAAGVAKLSSCQVSVNSQLFNPESGTSVVSFVQRDTMTDNNLFRPLNGPLDTFRRVGIIYWQSGTVRLFLKLAILFVVPSTCLLLAFVSYVAAHYRSQDGAEGFSDTFGYYVSILGSQSLIRSSLGALAEGAIAVAVADLQLQRQARWFNCLQKASTKVALLLITGLITGLATLIGYMFGFFPGLFLKLNFLLVVPVIILEDEVSVIASLGRSWDLVKGHRLYVLKCYLGLEGSYWLSTLILREFLKSDDGSRPYFSLTFHLLEAFPKSVFVPAFGILKTVLYINLLIIEEQLTEERFSNQIDQGMAGSASYVPLIEQHDDDDEMHLNFDQASFAPPNMFASVPPENIANPETGMLHPSPFPPSSITTPPLGEKAE